LQEFVRRLEREGELKRISTPADVDLEITEITDRVSKAGGPALLFERPRLAKNDIEYPMPILINMLGSERRMELALEVSSLEDVARRIEDLLDMKPPEGFLDKMRMLPKLSELGSFFPKSVKSGPAQEIVETDNASLANLPIMKCWPQDGGHFINFPNKEMGVQAYKDLLAKNYGGRTVDEALKKYSNKGYDAAKLGLGDIAGKKVGDLTEAEKTRMANAQFAGEGGTTRIGQELANANRPGGGSEEVRRREQEEIMRNAQRAVSEENREKSKTATPGGQSASMAATMGSTNPMSARDDIPIVISGLSVIPLYNSY
jgi:hypothetical protein